MKHISASLLTLLMILCSLISNGQDNPKWGSKYQFSTKLLDIYMSDDKTFPDSLNLGLHPMFQILPGLSFKSYKGKNAYRIDANYSQNYTNTKNYKYDNSYFSEANHTNLDIQFGFEHKFLLGRVYPYGFAMITAGYHNALGNSYNCATNPIVFDFRIFDINVGITGGYGFYFFLTKQLSISAEMNALFLNTWNNYTVEEGSYQETWNNYNFSMRSSASLGMNYYFNTK